MNKDFITMCVICYNSNKPCKDWDCGFQKECKIFNKIFHMYPYHIFNYSSEDFLRYLKEHFYE